jgi:dihydrofolate reductase
MGKAVIMGKKTWESLPRRPLSGRKNIVLTDTPDELIDSAITAYSIEDAIRKCVRDEDIFIIGGGSIYRQFMPLADRLYITHVHRKTPADVYFPEIDMEVWKVIEREDFISGDDKKIPYSYMVYERNEHRK